MKQILKIVLAFIISTTIIYLIFTARAFYKWCDKNYLLSIFNPVCGATDDLRKVEKDKIDEIGYEMELFLSQMEKSHEESPYVNDSENHYIGDGHENHTLGDFFNPVGFSIWLYMYGGLRDVFTGYIKISILLGGTVAISYTVITTKKINIIFKIILGYLLPIIIFPPIYMYSWTGRFWDISTMYFKSVPKYFYIGYTIIFILLYCINYIINAKRVKKLNEAIKKD